MHSISTRLGKAHYCSYLAISLEIFSSLANDTHEDISPKDHKHHATQLVEFFHETPHALTASLLCKLTTEFLHSARLPSIELDAAEHIYNCYPTLFRILLHHGIIRESISSKAFYHRQLNQEKAPSQRNCLKNPAKYFGPDRCISFGHYSAIIQVLRASILINPRVRLTFYKAPRYYSVFPDFGEILWLPNLHIIDLEDYELSLEEILAYGQHDLRKNEDEFGGWTSEITRKHWLRAVYKKFDYSSDLFFGCDQQQPLRQLTQTQELPFRYYSKKLSNITRERLSIPIVACNINSQVLSFIKNLVAANSRLILIANRDSHYTGATQPWRDSEIEKYHDAIAYLISRGYKVARINSIGQPLDLQSESFLDCSRIDGLSAYEQMCLFAHASLCIGVDTGISEYAQVFSIPIMYIDSALSYNIGFSGLAYHTPKALRIKDLGRLKKTSPHCLSDFLFNQCWTHSACSNLGLELFPLDKRQILDIVTSFVDSVSNFQNAESSTFALLSSYKLPIVNNRCFVSPTTYANIEMILSRYRD